MRAMVYRGPYKVRVEEKADPRIEHPNDAIVRVTLAAICGSDLHLYHGMMPDTRVGMTFGHEFMGVVEQVGPSVQNLEVGDRVMVPFNIFCGTCFFCARGLYSNCHNVNPNATAVGGIYGYSHTTGGYDGGQAELVRVPFADVGPSRIPEWMSDEDAVLCTDALATGYFGAQLGDIVEGDVVVVFGAGPVGPLRGPFGLADGGRPGHRRRPPRAPAREGPQLRVRRDGELHRARRHRAADEEDDRLPRRRRRHRRRGCRGRRQPHPARHLGASSSSRAGRRWR